MFLLCVCQYGHSRSVALARALHARGYSAVAAGTATAGAALAVLAEEAERILLLDEALRGAIPPKYHDKIISFHVGPDKWVNPYHPELRMILDTMLNGRFPPIGS